MSVQAIAWVLEHSEARLAARLVLLSIANHAKADGTGAWPSYDTLAKEAHISKRQAVRAVSLLVAEGHVGIEEKAGPKGTNLYSIQHMGGDFLSPDNRASGGGNTQLVTYPPVAGDKSDSPSDKSDRELVQNVTRTVLEPSRTAREPETPRAAWWSTAGPNLTSIEVALLRKLNEAHPEAWGQLSASQYFRLRKDNPTPYLIETLQHASEEGVAPDRPFIWLRAVAAEMALDAPEAVG